MELNMNQPFTGTSLGNRLIELLRLLRISHFGLVVCLRERTAVFSESRFAAKIQRARWKSKCLCGCGSWRDSYEALTALLTYTELFECGCTSEKRQTFQPQRSTTFIRRGLRAIVVGSPELDRPAPVDQLRKLSRALIPFGGLKVLTKNGCQKMKLMDYFKAADITQRFIHVDRCTKADVNRLASNGYNLKSS